MSVSQEIEEKVNKIDAPKVFTIDDLDFPADSWENVRVKLGRMIKSGQLRKVGRGKYYRPKPTMFGTIGPDQYEIVKDLMYDNDVLSGYITGYSIWNQMGLTTQVASIIIVGTSRRRDPVTRGHYRVRFIAQPNKITVDNIPLLQILDSIKMLKQIPDTTVNKSIHTLRLIIGKIEDKKLSLLVKLSMKYPPRVRAMLGAILESLDKANNLESLKKTLNPMTTYSMGIKNTTDFNFQNWNIR